MGLSIATIINIISKQAKRRLLLLVLTIYTQHGASLHQTAWFGDPLRRCPVQWKHISNTPRRPSHPQTNLSSCCLTEGRMGWWKLATKKRYIGGEWLHPLRRKVSQGMSRGGRSFQKLKTGYCGRFREISRCSLVFHCLTMSWPSMSSNHVRLPKTGGWKRIHHNQPQTNWTLKRLID